MAQPAQIERRNKGMADSLSDGHGSPSGEWSASCSPYCSLGMRWKESRTGCPAFLSKFIVIVVRKISKFIEFTPEQKERAATVDLEEFLLRQGEKLIKSGREKRLASDHSITVRGCEWFDHASNEGGRAVSFVQKYYGKSYIEAMSMLLGESMEPFYPQAKKQEPTEQKPFAPPVPNANMHRVFAYLLKTRGLDADVVSFFARKKMLYEDGAHHNAVFIGTDEGGCPRHAHLRSTNSFGKAFRLNVESSDPRYSFHHTGTDGSLYVFEAPIDMLSYISINPYQWQEHSYVACCGTSPIPVMQMLKPETQMVYLCLDNDDAGHKASERMAELLRERGIMAERLVPELKDWNDDLLHTQKEELAPCLSL